MQNSASSKLVQAIEVIRTVLRQALNSVLTFLGATEETSEKWRAVFQRKLLKGAVGFHLRWSHDVQNDVLWELEGLVKELSLEKMPYHHEEAEKKEPLLTSQQCYGYRSGQDDCNSCPLRPSATDCNFNMQGTVAAEKKLAFSGLSQQVERPVNTNDSRLTRSDSVLPSSEVCFGKKDSSSAGEKRYKIQAAQSQHENKCHQHLDAADVDSMDVLEQTVKTTLTDNTFLRGARNEMNKSYVDWNAHHASDSSDSSDSDESSDDLSDKVYPSQMIASKDYLKNYRLSKGESKTFRLCWTRLPFLKLASFIKDKMPEKQSDSNTLKRVSKVGLNIAFTENEDGREKAVQEVKTNSSDDCMKFDVSVKMAESFNPLGAIQRGIGFERLQLPQAPSDIGQVLRPSNDNSPIRLYHILQLPVNLLLFPVRLLSAWSERRQLKHSGVETRRQLKSVRNPLHETDQESLKLQEESHSTGRFLSGEEAYAYYNLLAEVEAKHKIKQMKKERETLIKIYKWKHKTLLDVVRIARDYYSDPSEVNLHRWKALKKGLSKDHDSDVDVRAKIATIPDHWPYFTFFIVLSQAAILIALCIQFGIDTVGLKTTKSARLGIPTFLGTETFTHLREPNLWIGPPEYVFYTVGAVLAPCMRRDLRTEAEAVSKGYRPFDENYRDYFGCCEMGSHFNTAGTTTLSECVDLTMGLGKWTPGLICSRRQSAHNSVAHIIKPCCTGYHGTCQMLSHEHCTFIKGNFHVECDHCVQVNCLADVCKVSKAENAIQPDQISPWLVGPGTRWQWWRLITAIPLTYGFIHLVLVLVIELTMMLPLEACTGWLRVMILYVCSATAGELMAGVVEPDLPHIGSTGGVGGILGVAALELLQAWSLIHRPLWEGTKLLMMFCLTVRSIALLG